MHEVILTVHTSKALGCGEANPRHALRIACFVTGEIDWYALPPDQQGIRRAALVEVQVNNQDFWVPVEDLSWPDGEPYRPIHPDDQDAADDAHEAMIRAMHMSDV